jgi:phosphatidylethanolamine/phosphatidyl-N-methylethanolamine N-methyltransferase
MIREAFVFLREGVLNFRYTGTICATSSWAAKALVNPLREARSPQRILELGPGTGSVTVEILKDMIPGDKLTICEINPRFMDALKRRLEENSDFQERKEDVEFFCGPVQDLPEKGTYDVIVCALPFLNFEIETVREIFQKLHRMSTDETVMTYYEYIGLRRVSKVVSSPERKQRILEIDSFFKDKHARDKIGHERVWLNFLPINIYTLRLANA